MLDNPPEDTASGPALGAMERAGKPQCLITSNIYAKAQRAGCKNVINLHGTIYENKCPHCGKDYTMEQVRDAKKILLCDKCGIPVRPQVSLFGEMVDSRRMTKTSNEISKAEVLLLLGTTLDSEVFGNYVKYFTGRWLVIIHPNRNYLDDKADMLFLDYPKNILPKLGVLIRHGKLQKQQFPVLIFCINLLSFSKKVVTIPNFVYSIMADFL